MPNPLPPPPPRRRGDATAARHENLSNADFRQMVMDTPRRLPPTETPRGSKKKKDEDGAKRANRKYRPKPKESREEAKHEELDLPKYRDRAKERREDHNPDYEVMTAGFGTLHAVAPPGAVDIPAADAQKISIENSKYLGGDVEHTHLVKGLDYALLNKVRSEMEKAVEAPEPEEAKENPPPKPWSEDDPVVFHSAIAKVVHQWLVKPPTANKINENFLPGRTAFVFDMEDMTNHLPNSLHRSKADCPAPEDYVTVGVDAPVLDRISKIMAYLKLGTSGKILRKRKKAGDKGILNEDAEELKVGVLSEQNGSEVQQQNDAEKDEQQPRNKEDDIFEDSGTDYIPTAKPGSPYSEDMEESPRNDQGPVLGPTMPAVQWHEYPGVAPSEETFGVPWPSVAEGQPAADLDVMSQEEKDRGLGSVFKRDDKKLQRRKELDAREKDPNFVSESYSECYPSYQEYNREIADSDEEGDLTKMDMGGKAKGRLHRWDFETEEEWAKYNDQKEAMPKAAFQFGVKMQDGRKTRKHREQKLNNELNKINQIIEKKKKGIAADGGVEEEDQPAKRLRS